MGCFWAVVLGVPVPEAPAGRAGGRWGLVPAPGWESRSSWLTYSDSGVHSSAKTRDEAHLLLQRGA